MALAAKRSAASGWVRTHQSELVQDHILALVHEKSVEVDLAFYDSPDSSTGCIGHARKRITGRSR